MKIAVLAPKGVDTSILESINGVEIVYYTGPPWRPNPDPCSLNGYNLVVAPPSYNPGGECNSRVTTMYPSLDAVQDALQLLGANSIASSPEDSLYKTVALLADEYKRLKHSLIESNNIPARPPPMIVAADYYPGSIEGGLRLYSEGADIVVVSSSRRGWRSIVEDLIEAGIPTGVDAGLDTSIAIEAAEMGTLIVMSLTENVLNEIPSRLRNRSWWVLIPEKLSRDPYERANSLASAASRASRLGYSRLVLDPVAQPLVDPGFLTPLYAARLLSGGSYPVMLGLNNVYEMADADTTGSIPILVSLAFEAGVSMVLASEESSKARGAVLETVISTFMVYLASRWRTTIKNLGVRLLLAKEKRMPAPL